MNCSIYLLRDPSTQEIKYIGQTIDKLSKRLYAHISQKNNSPKSQWIQNLFQQGLKPIIELVEIVDVEKAVIQ